MNSTLDMLPTEYESLSLLYWVAWVSFFVAGLAEIFVLAADEDARLQKQAVSWNVVGQHPDMTGPVDVYKHVYPSGKSAYRWKHPRKDQWVYGSNPWTQ